MTDQFGGRVMFPTVSALTIIPVLFVGFLADSPTGIRPIDPTTTGNRYEEGLLESAEAQFGAVAPPSGLIKAQAQKLSRNPIVANASMRHAGAAALVAGIGTADDTATAHPLQIINPSRVLRTAKDRSQ